MRSELLVNGRITTLEKDAQSVEALVVQDGRIAYAGNRHDAEGFARSIGSHVAVDLEGKRVIPGLFDLHAHLDREGLKSIHPPLSGVKDRRDVLQRVADLARSTPAGEWIVTMPIGDPPFYFFAGEEEEKGLYPTRWELDEVAPANPVYIRPIVGFWRWSPLKEVLVSAANSLALEAAGIRDDLVAPSPSVYLERDAGHRLTGRFFETTTISIVELMYFARRTAFSQGDRIAALRQSQRIANSFGITSIFEGHGVETAVLNAYKTLRAHGELNIRAELAFSPSWSPLESFHLHGFIDRWAGWLAGPGIGDDHLRVRGLFVNALKNDDDSIRARCGCYTGFAGYNFDSAIAEASLPDLLLAMAQVDIRAVGLSRRLFELYRSTHARTPLTGKAWMVQHCGPLSDAEISLAADLRLGLSVLPVEYIYKQGSIARSDPALAKDWMPLRRLVDRGVRFSLATDNIPPTIFFAMWLCLERTDRNGDPVPDPDGPLEREEVIKAATLWSAEILGCADRRGSLRTGKDADLAVLSTDILACPLEEIRDTRALATMRGGDWIYLAPDAPADIRNVTRQKRLRN